MSVSVQLSQGETYWSHHHAVGTSELLMGRWLDIKYKAIKCPGMPNGSV